MFGFAATSDGGFILAGNDELNGDDYYATKLAPEACGGTTAVSQLNTAGSYTVLPYGAIIGDPTNINTSLIGPTIYTPGSYNETWSGNFLVQGYVDIQPGYTLTIDHGANIQFANKAETGVESKIVVEPGAKLDIHGTLTSIPSCVNEMWDGVELRGQTGPSPANSSQAQNTTNMGEVIMESDGTLSNANLGIFTMKLNVDQSWDFGHTGGIIIGYSGGQFINNMESVDMQAYTNPSNAGINLGNFNGCTFQTTDYSYQPVGFAPDVHVCLNKVHGVNLTGNTFECNEVYPTGSYISLPTRGDGINSFDATYTVNSSNQFENLQYGIKANSISAYGINADNNTFSNNKWDMLLEGAAPSRITNNTCTKTTFGSDYVYQPYNLYLQGCFSFIVSGNNFSSGSMAPPSWGSVVNYSWFAPNVIDHNTYTGYSSSNSNSLIIGAQAQGIDNGLTFHCNSFASPIPTADIFVTNAATINPVQGVCNNNLALTANNSFSQTSGADDIYDNGNNFTYNWSGANTSSVYYPATIAGTFSVTVSPFPCLIGTPDCSSGNWWSNKSTMRSSALANKYSGDSATTIIDSGNAVHLYNYIADGYTPARLQDSMLNAGPYLSDGILNDLIGLNMPFDTLRNILVPNAPLDNAVKSTLDASAYYTPADTVRIDTITGTSARTLLQQDIQFFSNETGIYANGLVTYYLNDTIAGNVDSAINALYLTGATLTNPQLAELATLQNIKGDTASAMSTISSISATGDTNMADFCSLMPIVMRLEYKPDNFYALTTLSADSSIIAGIANDSTKLGFAQARSLLEMVYNKHFADPILTLGGGARYANPNNNGNANSLPIGSGFKLYPNPANTELTIGYSLIPGSADATMKLYDLLGNKIGEYTLPSSNTTITENISNLGTGFYVYAINNGNTIVQRGKIIIAR